MIVLISLEILCKMRTLSSIYEKFTAGIITLVFSFFFTKQAINGHRFGKRYEKVEFCVH
jgi:hypothetical protein